VTRAEVSELAKTIFVETAKVAPMSAWASLAVDAMRKARESARAKENGG
jgi:hypothetical protein